MLALRKVVLSDLELILKWKNDPITQKMSFDSRPLSLQEHTNWFTKAINDPSKIMYIGRNEEGYDIGIVRIERKTDDYSEISINIAPEHRGRGYGAMLIREASVKALKDGFCRNILAKIRNSNASSVKAFIKAGFKGQRETSNGSIELTLNNEGIQ